MNNERLNIEKDIKEGQKHWDDTKKKIQEIKINSISEFGINLIKLDDKLKTLDMKAEQSTPKQFLNGAVLTRKLLLHTLSKNGISLYEPLNEKFNPTLHQKVGQMIGEGEKGIINEVIEQGWTVNNKIYRMPKVNVTK